MSVHQIENPAVGRIMITDTRDYVSLAYSPDRNQVAVALPLQDLQNRFQVETVDQVLQVMAVMLGDLAAEFFREIAIMNHPELAAPIIELAEPEVHAISDIPLVAIPA